MIAESAPGWAFGEVIVGSTLTMAMTSAARTESG